MKIYLSLKCRAPDPVFGQNRILIPGFIPEFSHSPSTRCSYLVNDVKDISLVEGDTELAARYKLILLRLVIYLGLNTQFICLTISQEGP